MGLVTRLGDSLRSWLAALTTVARIVEGVLTPSDDWVERWHNRLLGTLDPLARALGHPTAYRKGRRDYITTAQAPPDTVERALLDAGYQRNLVSAAKYRRYDETKQWTVGQYVVDPVNTDWQHHVYLFPVADGTDVYGHRETTVRQPEGHLTDPQVHGDPNHRVRTVLARSSIVTQTRQW